MTPQAIAHYQITAKLGEGGMGEVYRALDTRLKREVAIKILPDTFAGDPERMARFQREAEVLASLNHPNIAHIYGVEERALVMELVEGEALAGPLAMETALDYARQIAEALEYAHERGVIHRDLKPANIKVTPKGEVKLLDFGLAKAYGAEESRPVSDPANSPTVTLGATAIGTVLGTAAYMAPEQAKGKPVDKRADIWAFGVLLYEMLTGKPLFQGDDIPEILAAVIHQTPDLSAASAGVRTLLERCLQKDPRKRLRDIGDAMPLVEMPALFAPVTAARQHRLWAMAAALFAFVAAALGYVAYRHVTEPPAATVKVSLLPPENGSFAVAGLSSVSPDGRQVAFAATVDARQSLWVRSLDSLNSRQLGGTEGAAFPFWSPDSRSLGFFAAGKLKRIDLAGGSVVTVCDAGSGRGASWSKNNVIIFAPDILTGLFRVPAAGGTAMPITAIDAAAGENSHRYPWFLPDGRHFLYTSRNRNAAKTTLYLGDIESNDDAKTRRAVRQTASNVIYANPGYLLFVQDQTLMAQPFEASKGQVTGDPVPVTDNVDYVGLDIRGHFSASQNGVLAYVSGVSLAERLTWVDRSGKELGAVGTEALFGWPSISPDGKTIAIDRINAPSSSAFDLWLLNPERGTETRFTFGPGNKQGPIWSPDGSQIAYSKSEPGAVKLYRQSTAGSAHEQLLDSDSSRPIDWSPDGRYIIERRLSTESGIDIWVLPLFGDRKPFAYLASPFRKGYARVSPDGKWLAYTSNETGRDEVYVGSFPTPGDKRQISVSGGWRPRWSRDGKELFFVSGDGKMMAVAVKSSGKFQYGTPHTLFDTRMRDVGEKWFDVSTDGRFLIPRPIQDSSRTAMTLVMNWTAGLKK